MKPTLSSLISEIESSDPRMHEFSQNAHEFRFFNFAYDAFRDDETALTISSIADVLDVYIEAEDEGQLNNDRDGYKHEGAEDFIELLEVFKQRLNDASFKERADFFEELQAEIAEALADGKDA